MNLFESLLLLDKENHFLRKTKMVESKPTLDLKTNLDFYLYFCTKSYSSLSVSINKAKMSLELLDYNYICKNEDEKNPKNAYMELFIENSIIRIQAIYDRALILVNRVLELGISNENINHNLMVTNENVIKFGLDKKLKSLNKACNEYRYLRNTIVHHDRFSEEEFDLLTFIHFANDLGVKTEINPSIPQLELQEITIEYMSDCKLRLQEYLTNIEEKLLELLDSASFVLAEKKLSYGKI